MDRLQLGSMILGIFGMVAALAAMIGLGMTDTNGAIGVGSGMISGWLWRSLN